MLNEIIIYGNPIVYNNVGHPPLLKQYLIDRLGINLQRQRPLKALKTPLLLPQRDHRIIDTSVPKIPRMPVELRMLTYTEDNVSSGSAAPRLLSSGASSTSQFEESVPNSHRDQQQQPQSEQTETTRRQSHPSASSSGSGRRRGSGNHVYKPFKQERGQQQQANVREMPAYEESSDNEYDETEDYYDSNQTNQTLANKNYNSFFMTQVSH